MRNEGGGRREEEEKNKTDTKISASTPNHQYHRFHQQPAGTANFGSRGGFFACVGDDDNNASAFPAPSVSFIICIDNMHLICGL